MDTQADHIIDGSQGEGGGQILRTALSLAMCTGQAVRIENIRAGRTKPGLMRSHLAAVQAAAQVSCAELIGAEMNSTCIEFWPQAGAINGGTYRFSIGTAGSTTLLMQTLLPALLMAKAPTLLMLSGGTHNGMSPSVDFIEHAFLPALARMGIEVSSDLRRHGFFPVGGGEWHVIVQPRTQVLPFEALERGQLRSREVVAKVARLPEHIAQRELEIVNKRSNLRKGEARWEQVDSPGPGNIVSARLRFERISVVFEQRGEKRVTAEQVAKRLMREMADYLERTEPVDEYLADQLMLPMVLGAGGAYRTCALSEHSMTNMQVIEQWLGKPCFALERERSGGVLVRVEGVGASRE